MYDIIRKMLIFYAVVFGLAGWGAIEFVLWLVSKISFGWG